MVSWQTQFGLAFQRGSLTTIACAMLIIWPLMAWGQATSLQTDVVIFAATPAGIAAALAAAEDECDVLLIEPTARIGGMVTNGLSHTDFHSRESLSGSFLHFSKRVLDHYQKEYGADSPQALASDGGVFAEPKVNLAVFRAMLAQRPRIRLLTEHQLVQVALRDLPAATPATDDSPATGAPFNGSTVNSSRISSSNSSRGPTQRIESVQVRSPSGQVLTLVGRCVIDASYEGDLMAMAGVPWHAGREARATYGESLAPEEADDQLQAYNFRFIMTQEPTNRVKPKAPEGYRREDFLEVLPAFKPGQIERVFSYPSKCVFKAHLPPLPNQKYDINDVSRSLIRLSLPGKNLDWPNGSPEQRRAIFVEHLRDQVGLLYFLQNDPAVPEDIQREAASWGWCRDEFEQSDHLPDQLYVREARRMVGMHVYTQGDSEHAPGDARAVLHRDAIAMGDYGNNCHGTFHEGPRFGGRHTGEFYNPVPPYQVPYYALLPHDLDNLLVPGAVSSSHVGFCGLRLEPIWMSLGEAAGLAAAWSVKQGRATQELPVAALQQRLHRYGAATIYVSDCLPGHPDFRAVQWWGSAGGLHGLEPLPEKPGQRGRNLHGQYFEANPGHAVLLDKLLDEKTLSRWLALASLLELDTADLPTEAQSTTRGDFIRRAFQSAEKSQPWNSHAIYLRLNPKAVRHTHPPGEVDNAQLLKRVVTRADQLAGIVMDDTEAILQGTWQYSAHTPPYVGLGYLHDQNLDKGRKSARFVPRIPAGGRYELRLSHCTNIRRAVNTLVTVQHADGQTQLRINQQQEPEHAGLFRTLGIFNFHAGTDGWIEISNDQTEGKYVIVDAIQLLPVVSSQSR